ncbi:beta-ketoacyl-[acyl-carrier-protein] synthase family protein [Streptomyces coeruleoprunus]|uniref:Beta-ketoacyl-[acyl-carrier-protein] synthase family protein n=1 Tax=Streptomyces coeruleoprunus TaxID=285563 RepID=A0ABV9XGB9_9ACTN
MHVRERVPARQPNDIAVTGLGLVTPAGPDVESTWDGLLDGRSLAARDARLTGLPVDFSCRVAGFDGPAAPGRTAERCVRLGLAAAREAVADAGWAPGPAGASSGWGGARVALVLGHGGGATGSAEASNTLAEEVAGALGVMGPGFLTSSGCSSGATAIGVARDLLRAGCCDVVVTGGSESARHPLAAAAFSRMGALSSRRHDPAGASRPFDADRDGFVLGEGAGVLVLERLADARARRAPVRAVLAGYGAASGSRRPEGLERAVRAALGDAGLGPDDIDHVNADGAGTPLDDLTEARVLRRLFRGTPPPVTAVKSVLGHAIGGAGAVEAVCTVLTLCHQAIPPTANLDRLDPDIDLDVVTKSPRRRPVRAALSHSSGFGGQSAVLLFRTP